MKKTSALSVILFLSLSCGHNHSISEFNAQKKSKGISTKFIKQLCEALNSYSGLDSNYAKEAAKAIENSSTGNIAGKGTMGNWWHYNAKNKTLTSTIVDAPDWGLWVEIKIAIDENGVPVVSSVFEGNDNFGPLENSE